MSPLELRLIDENEVQRETYAAALNALMENTGVVVAPMAPLNEMQDYIALLAEKKISGLILDQKLEDGGFSYSGSQLATFLRSIFPKLPIVILTNYKHEQEQFDTGEKDVEYICAKDEIKDPDSRPAQIIKARLLRRLNVFADVLGERERRYHDLLVKSLKEPLSAEDEKELGLLEEARVLPVQATEVRESQTLEKALEELRKRVGEGEQGAK